jgi:hypothetical protein
LYAFGIALGSVIISFIMIFITKLEFQTLFFISAGILTSIIILLHVKQNLDNKKLEQEMKIKMDKIYKESTKSIMERSVSVASKPIDGKGPEGLNSFKWGRNEHINSEQLQHIENSPDEAIYRITSRDELVVYNHKVDSIICSFYKENLYKITVYFDHLNRDNIVEDIRRQIMYKYGRNTTEIASTIGWDWHGISLSLSNEMLTMINHFFKKRD